MLTRYRCFALAAFILAAGCTTDSTDSTDPDKGLTPQSFTLRSINGQDVPLTASIRNAVRVEITSGAFNIEPNFRFTNSTTYRRTENGQVTTSVENCVGNYDITSTTAGDITLAFIEFASENPLCGVQLSASGTGGRDRSYGGTLAASNLTIDFDPTTHSVYGK